MHCKLLALTAFLFFRLCAAAQLPDSTSYWTNGYCFFSSGRINDSTWLFDGGNLHEGAWKFGLRMRNNGHLYIIGGNVTGTPEEDITPAIGKPGDEMTYRVVDGNRVLLLGSPGAEIRDCFRAMKPDEDLEKQIISSKTNYELAGKYVDKRTAKAVVFYPDKQEADGLATGKRYRFHTIYDDPVSIISFDFGPSYYYEKTDDGLNIFKVKINKDGEDDWDKGALVMSLKKTDGYDPSHSPNPKGRYPFSSAEVLTEDILGSFTVTELNRMRNEIYARHGHVFSTPALKAYFQAQSWYQPAAEGSETPLTKLEELNVQLIRHHTAP